MGPKINNEALIEAFTDSRVIQAIVAAITPAIKACLEEQLTEVRTALKLVQTDQVNQNLIIKELQAENSTLKRRVEVIDLQSRLSSVIIRGLPEKSYSERASGLGKNDSLTTVSTSSVSTGLIRSTAATEEAVLDLFNKDLSLNMTPGDIASAYRLKSKDSNTPRPIHVTFSTRKGRDSVISQRRMLKLKSDAKVFISEDLTKHASELFFEARKLVQTKRLNSAWTAGGNVFVKRLLLDNPRLILDTASLMSAC